MKDLMVERFLSFLFYAVCGWIYEVALGFRYGRGFINRGFLFGPWLPVYGFGAMLMLPLQKLKKYGPLAVFAVSTMYATLIELIASYAMEIVNGAWLTKQVPPRYLTRMWWRQKNRF